MPTKKKADTVPDESPVPENQVEPKKAAPKKAAPKKAAPKKVAPKKVAPKKTDSKKTTSASQTKRSKLVQGESSDMDSNVEKKVIADMKESLTPEEKERLEKLKATVKLFKADPEWPDFIQEQTESLLDLRAALVPNMTSVTRDHLRSGASNESSSSGQHIGDAGSDAEVRDLTIRLLDKDREQLFEIDAALDRIRRGTYGVCEISLQAIPKGRLRVRPYCRLTVKCQEEYEKKHGTASLFRSSALDIIGYAGTKSEGESDISLDDDE